jgi:hypothetical protein
VTEEQIRELLMGGDFAATPTGGGPSLADIEAGEVAGFGALSPGATGWTELNYEPGTYVAVCFIPDTTGWPISPIPRSRHAWPPARPRAVVSSARSYHRRRRRSAWALRGHRTWCCHPCWCRMGACPSGPGAAPDRPGCPTCPERSHRCARSGPPAATLATRSVPRPPFGSAASSTRPRPGSPRPARRRADPWAIPGGRFRPTTPTPG